MKQIARRFLDGVGHGETGERWDNRAFHVRRALSDAELAEIPAVWLALPAVDGE